VRPANRAQGAQGSQDNSVFANHSERPPLPPGEGWGEGNGLRRHSTAKPLLRSPTLTLPRKREREPFSVKRNRQTP
jgi:hypothetical protein